MPLDLPLPPGALPTPVTTHASLAVACGTHTLVYHVVPTARRYARAHIVVNVFSLVCWGASFAVPMPYRLCFWYPSLAADVGVTFFMSEHTRVRALGIA